jgi:hypothetical protein
MNEYTLEKIQDDARDQEWMERREANGETMCDQCGCWDDVDAHGYGPVVEIIDTATDESWCRACALETQVPGNSMDALVECAYCGEWDWEADGTVLEDDTMSLDRVMPREVWTCHFCTVNRGDVVVAWFDGMGE